MEGFGSLKEHTLFSIDIDVQIDISCSSEYIWRLSPTLKCLHLNTARSVWGKNVSMPSIKTDLIKIKIWKQIVYLSPLKKLKICHPNWTDRQAAVFWINNVLIQMLAAKKKQPPKLWLLISDSDSKWVSFSWGRGIASHKI